MKRISFFILIIFGILISSQTVISQSYTWKVKAIESKKSFLDVVAIDEMGESHEVVAISGEQGNHFMDVKVMKAGELLPVKMIISNEYYVPVKGIGPNGELFDIKAISGLGKKLDIKGINRAGSTIVMAAINNSEKFLKLKAISPEGVMRDLYGVKFKEDNIEMEIGVIKVLAHVKALPAPTVDSRRLVWDLNAIDKEGNALPIYATDKKGNDYGVKALVKGGSYYLLDVKAVANYNEISIKLMIEDGEIKCAAIDDMGELLPVRAKGNDGNYYDIIGVLKDGKIFDIKAISGDDYFAVKAISGDGDYYDIKGIKVKDRDEEGEILGIKYSHFFYAHVKAIPPVQ